MKLYMTQETNPFRHLPKPLWPRLYAEIHQRAEAMGIKPVSSDGAGGVTIDIRNSTRAQVTEFLQGMGAICVDVQPEDIFVLMGGQRSVEVLAARRALENGTIPAEYVERRTIEELDDVVRYLLTCSYAEDPPEVGSAEEEIILDDLKRHGFDVPTSSTLDDASLRDSEGPNIYVSSVGNTYDNNPNLRNYFPDADDAEAEVDIWRR